MLEYHRIDISEIIDVNNTNVSKECEFAIFGISKILVLNMNEIPLNHIFAMVFMI